MKTKRRSFAIHRATKETDINIELSLDGEGKASARTGIPFLDHMIESFARHGFFDIKVTAKGDLEVDIHHTNEDVGICLGQVFAKAWGMKEGMNRFGFYYMAMDEALVRVVLDVSGRPSLYFTGECVPKGAKLNRKEKEYSFNYLKQFLYAFCIHSGVNMNVGILGGEDAHHVIEATFKAFGRALAMAVSKNTRIRGIPSTKGMLE